MSPYEKLVNAIIQQAASDHRRAAKFLRQHLRTKKLETAVAKQIRKRKARIKARRKGNLPPVKETKSAEELLLDRITYCEELIADTEEFFLSDWFTDLTDVGGGMALGAAQENGGGRSVNVKEFLEQAINLDAAIESNVAKLDNYRRLAMRIGGSRLEEHISHSAHTEAPYAKWVERIIDTEQEVNEEIDMLVDAKLAINKFIDGVSNMRWQCILRSRYVMCLPWSQIASDLGCSLSTVKRDHNKALSYLESEKTVNRCEPI